MTGRLPTVELLIVRHADAERKADTDFVRPLSKRGRDDAVQVGVRMNERGLRPDAILSSPALRALETARLALPALGEPAPPLRTEATLYDASREAVAKAIAAHAGEARRLMVVGHNPSLSDLASWLASLPPGWSLGKAAVAQLRLRSTWKDMSRGCGRLVDLFEDEGLRRRVPRPEDMPVEEA